MFLGTYFVPTSGESPTSIDDRRDIRSLLDYHERFRLPHDSGRKERGRHRLIPPLFTAILMPEDTSRKLKRGDVEP